MPTLHFFRDNTPIFRQRLPSSTPFRIGRDPSCDAALVGQGISRSHCEVRPKGQGWVLHDLGSRHGTLLNDNTIEEAPLNDGDRIGINEITAVFRQGAAPVYATGPCEEPRLFEELVAIDNSIHVTRSAITVVDGPDRGRSWPMTWRACSIGGPGSSIELTDPDVQPQHCRLFFSFGRAVLVPGKGRTTFSGNLIRASTPLWAGEEFCIGSTRIRLEQFQRSFQMSSPAFGEMLSHSEKMHDVFGTLAVVSGHTVSVLLQGESGTGKELAARGIHEQSKQTGAFVAVNCGGITGSLWESELFGHEKGAFTGATERKDGFFQQADSGTLFLDEIGDLPLEAQVKLLRALGEGEVRRVGGRRVERPNVRVIAATNRNLLELVEQGRFRKDLFFRLSGYVIELPPLRARSCDIPLLTRHFLETLQPGATISDRALSLLESHSWPGNVRELKQTLMRALCHSNHITEQNLTFYDLSSTTPAVVARSSKPYQYLKRSRFERDFLIDLMEKHNGNRAAAARSLQMHSNSLRHHLEKAGLWPPKS